MKEIASSDTVEQVSVQDLHKICHMFSQETVFNFLTELKSSRLIDLVVLVQDRGARLSIQQSVELVMASIALSGPCWQGSVNMLSKNSPPQIEIVL